MTGYRGPSAWAVDADAVFYAMRRRGLETLDSLAGAAGVSYATLHHALSGETARPSADTMCRVAEALGCDVMDLMERGDG